MSPITWRSSERCDILATALQELIEAELTTAIDAAHGENSCLARVAERQWPDVVVDTGW